ncbi:protein MpRLK-Pelle_L-LEC28 [Marchantia polymorpha subsp. ruderalis]|uniref:Protein kinase domain-containing protein n=2 Tax=Marchantia polymorpha TaxID=3197 RepID=A0AAF6BS09_MARPO|nr:hypothetical protein MARPO_0047s0109 [Marchantia polymorpha]BBN14793.1 hypothetical protein Mp_6g14550 [Marchantia polymorpha subsp. ruderalis]|eukprot:PTQ39137.1 hypothetical protein MARPO_0047s0109 [Marchantia polymorpha]
MSRPRSDVNVLLVEMTIVIMTCKLISIPVRANFTVGTSAGGQPFQCGQSGNVWCGGQVEADTQRAELRLKPSFTNATDHYDAGIAVWAEPITLFNTSSRKWNSFSSRFQFRWQMSSSIGAGYGISFVMRNILMYRDLGTQTVVPSVAVEYNIRENLGNEEFDNIRVRVELETGRASLPMAPLDPVMNISKSSAIVFTWIDYNSSSQDLQVRLSSNDAKPADALLRYRANLTFVLGQDEPDVYVGLSAANGKCNCSDTVTVSGWSFESFPLPPLEPSPKPQQQPAEVAPLWSPGWRTEEEFRRGSRNQPVAFISGVSAAAVFLLVLCAVVIVLLGRSKYQQASRSISMQTGSTRTDLDAIARCLENSYSFVELRRATAEFDEAHKLGQGGFGSVYRAVIPATGEVVAVKKVSPESRQGAREFMAEVSIITQLRHRNIVKLLGWCSANEQFLLVYEYMPNGSLDKALFCPADEASVLSWEVRFRIVMNVATALNHLHEGWRQKVLHRDIKSSNIMLDEDFNALLGDFGLARLVDRRESLASTNVVGTFGYLAPEVVVYGKFSDKADVYAFGAVALEIACGQASVDQSRPEGEKTLADLVWSSLRNGDLLRVVDRRLAGKFDPAAIKLLLLVGLLCSHPNPDERPPMRQVIMILEGIVPMPPIPLSKPVLQFHNRSGRLYQDAPSTPTTASASPFTSDTPSV